MERLAKYAGKKVMVTGGLGFIGSNMAHRLVELGADVLIVDALLPGCGGNPHNIEGIRDKVQISSSDLRDSDAMGQLVKGQEIVFNLAGKISHIESMRDPFADLEINTRSQLSLLEACRAHNPDVKIIYAGTRQIYGIPEYLPVDERHPLQPVDINGIHKMAGGWYHIVFHKVYGLRACTLRLTNTYGPRMVVRDSRQGVIGWFIKQALDGEEIKLFGGGGQLRDMTYVDDAVSAFLFAGVTDEVDGQFFNLGGEAVSLLSLVQLLTCICGSGSYAAVDFPPERKRIDIGDYYSDYRKAKRVLDWMPTTTLAQGLQRTVDFFRRNKEHYW
ncbi:MAG: NAD-dependent epimerase/dehydratase family protein [Chloroflexi bacterium]|nr:NAD-dependent epimerase/dehydratase family protein [Chloroflexota bacterium]